jgi:hypothetical protein
MAQGGEIVFDMSKARRLIDFEPKYTLADAIQSIKDWVDSGGLEAEQVVERDFGSGVQQQ